MTGTVSTVDVDQARKGRPAITVYDMPRGCVSAVFVTEGAGGDVSIRIRGTTSITVSITVSNDPLHVVDGMPAEPSRGGTLSRLNPNDIESTAALKVACATAIYGTRSASGVIMIKTKR